MFNTFVYNPLYNTLVGILDIIPGGNVFFAVILLTVIVKLILLPLTKKSIITQIKSKDLNEELKQIKVQHKDNREVLGRKTLELYKKHGINPFTSLLLIIIQIPIILALFFIFSGGGLPEINPEILYSFVPAPEVVQMTIAGFNLAEKSFFFAFLAAFTQFLYLRRVVATTSTKKKDVSNNESVKKGDKEDFIEDLTRTMNVQMQYILPVIVLFAGYTFSAVVALYWTISNIFTYLQDVYIRSQIKNNSTVVGEDVVDGKVS